MDTPSYLVFSVFYQLSNKGTSLLVKREIFCGLNFSSTVKLHTNFSTSVSVLRGGEEYVGV